MSNAFADQMTGCHEHPRGLGKYYAGPINRNGWVTDSGEEFADHKAAYDFLREGGEVGVPHAGAGSYDDVFRSLGFTEVEVVEQGSSAGDWSFGVRDGAEGPWHYASQDNRYPYHGFKYRVDFDSSFPSFEALCKVGL